MDQTKEIFLGGGGADYTQPQTLLLKYANRHGLIAGATGTGKTVTLQILAESFSNIGTPVFLADVKGDLSGLAEAGSPEHKLHENWSNVPGRSASTISTIRTSRWCSGICSVRRGIRFEPP
jgi:DNA helicase HerA-like ATPase